MSLSALQLEAWPHYLTDEPRLSALHLTLRDLAHFLESQPFLFAAFTHDDVRLAANAAK